MCIIQLKIFDRDTGGCGRDNVHIILILEQRAISKLPLATAHGAFNVSSEVYLNHSHFNV